MTPGDVDAAIERADTIARREVVFRWASVAVACIAMLLSGLGLIIVSQRGTDSRDKIEQNEAKADTAKTRADKAAERADTAESKATTARKDLNDIIRVLLKKKIVKDGKTGLRGSTGPRGLVGAAGPAGRRGPQGLRGPPGPAGRDATVTRDDLLETLRTYCAANPCRGPAGPTGAAGPTGPTGPAGKDGAPPPRAFQVFVPTSNGPMVLVCVDPEDDRTYQCSNSNANARP